MNNNNKRYSRGPKVKDEIIDLTDTSGHNTMPVIRELETDPVTGCVTVRAAIDPKNKHLDGFEGSVIQVVPEDRGLAYSKPKEPEDPEPGEDDRLEAEGAFIINSTTYYPASNTTITKKSQTPVEIAEERGYQNFVER